LLNLQNPLNLKEFSLQKAVCGKGAKPSQTAFLLSGLHFCLFRCQQFPSTLLFQALLQAPDATGVPEVSRKSQIFELRS
jgi:hypothetical protein